MYGVCVFVCVYVGGRDLCKRVGEIGFESDCGKEFKMCVLVCVFVAVEQKSHHLLKASTCSFFGGPQCGCVCSTLVVC